MFVEAEFVQFEMLKPGDAGQPQRVGTAFQRTTVNDQSLRRGVNHGKNGLHASTDAREAGHARDTEFLQPSRRVVGEFAGGRTAGTRQHAGQAG
jgi:hypothetical protein